MSKELDQSDYENFRNFEETITNLKDSAVIYKQDFEMESQIKKDVLFEKFGAKPTQEVMEKLNLNYVDLADHKIYIEIYKFLDSSK
jgi:hypothetical protein